MPGWWSWKHRFKLQKPQVVDERIDDKEARIGVGVLEFVHTVLTQIEICGGNVHVKTEQDVLLVAKKTQHARNSANKINCTIRVQKSQCKLSLLFRPRVLSPIKISRRANDLEAAEHRLPAIADDSPFNHICCHRSSILHSACLEHWSCSNSSGPGFSFGFGRAAFWLHLFLPFLLASSEPSEQSRGHDGCDGVSAA